MRSFLWNAISKKIVKAVCLLRVLYYHTMERKRYPIHWHSAIELIYILNVIDSNVIHKFQYEHESMIVVVHFSRSSMKNLVPELDEYKLCCIKATMKKEQLEVYLRICDFLKKPPLLHLMWPMGYKIKSHAIAMEIFFELLNVFAEKEGAK